MDNLTKLLQAEQAFMSDGAILKNAVIEAALNMDARLLELLMQSDTIKAHFFTPVAGALVFDKVKFQDFVSNKAFLPDSYTAYRNRIGLTNGRDYLSQSRDVVLAWPYKDCVLEGGMTKEDRGRNEVFWNTTLAPDDITRLFEPKVLTGWERWDAEAVAEGKAKPVGEVSEDDNLLIKGNNLLALHSLKARYAGKVKLIYIDPPYNTGTDEFKYNDRFRRSSWLTFMKNRLIIARELLTKDGALVVQIGDHESGSLRMLMDELFDGQFVNQIAVRTKSPSGFKTVNQGVFETAEYLYLYAKNKTSWVYQPQFTASEYDANYKQWIENPNAAPNEWIFRSLHDVVAEQLGYESKKSAIKDLGKPIFEARLAASALEHANRVFRLTTVNDDAGKETLDAKQRSLKTGAVEVVEREGFAPRFIFQGQEISLYSNKVREIDGTQTPSTMLTNIWTDISWEGIAKEGGVTLSKGKKPERLLRRIIEMATKKGDLVLDFFTGSGTTAAVAQKLERRWIAIEQLDYIETLAKKRLKSVIAGDKSGVSKLVSWEGGGSFIYAELAAFNSAFADRIVAAPDMAALQTVHADMQATGYLRYDVDLSAFGTDDFGVLPLDDAKHVLMDCLDANHLYVNLGALGDTDFNVSDEDARATRSFYGISE
ncbi:site-specific DNA-methyltransferase [Sneathiella sp.]|uniref:DNA methyltransferase n=1 Tax=Sneathiella sp. TaxID=1964365 RepID=UPI0025D3CC7D|nr:site-specific DNA-methyltransferase [Sneathiella sp.]